MIVAKLNDAFRRLLSRATAAIGTVARYVADAASYAAQAQDAADRAQQILPIDQSIEEANGVVRIKAAVGSVKALVEELATRDGRLTGAEATLLLLSDEVQTRLSRDVYDATSIVGVLAAPAEGSAINAVSVRSLTTTLSPPDAVVAITADGDAVRLDIAATVAPSETAVAVAIEPRTLALPAETPLYLPTSSVNTTVRELAAELQRLQQGTGITGYTLFGQVAEPGVPAGDVTSLPLDELLLPVGVGELIAVVAADGTRLVVTATAAAGVTDQPVSIEIEQVTVPAGGIDAGTPVVYALSELSSLFRQTLDGFGRAVTEVDLTAAAGICEVAEAVDDEARTTILVTPVDLGDQDAAIENGGILVILTPDGPVNLILTDTHNDGTDDEGIALKQGDTVIHFFEQRFSAEIGNAVVLPARYAYTYAEQTARRFYQEAATGVSRSEFEQTAEEIRAEIIDGNTNTFWRLIAGKFILQARMQSSNYNASTAGWALFEEGLIYCLSGLHAQDFFSIPGFNQLSGQTDVYGDVFFRSGTDVDFARRPTHAGSGLATVDEIPDGVTATINLKGADGSTLVALQFTGGVLTDWTEY